MKFGLASLLNDTNFGINVEYSVYMDLEDTWDGMVNKLKSKNRLSNASNIMHYQE